MRTGLVGAGAAVLLVATVATGLYLGFETRDRFERVDESWRTFESEADHRGALLSRLRGHLGYGGIIHNFKNFVLRQDETYLKQLDGQFADFNAAVSEFRQLDPGPQASTALLAIESTILDYEAKLSIAKQAAAEGWPPSRTDGLVKVDDRGALEALALLASDWRERRRVSSSAIRQSVGEGRELIDLGFNFLGGLAAVALALFGLFYLLMRELHGTVRQLRGELHERQVAQHAAKKFLSAVDQAPATIIITGTDGRIEYVNDKFCDVSGYSAGEVIGKTPGFLQSGETADATYLELRRRIALGEEWRGLFCNRKKAGGTYLAETAILPLRDTDGSITHYIGIGEDITEKSLAQERMQKAQKMEAVGMLASGVAHDFNNVLTTILGNVHLALMETIKGDALRDELEQIDIAAKRARHMVREILTFARRQPGVPRDMRVGEVVMEVCRLMKASLAKDITLVTNIEDASLSVHADPTRLHQVIMNLCANAAEAIGAERGSITISVARHVAGEQVSLVVADDGPGMPPDVQTRVFEPFFTTKLAGKGTGLGLAVVANLIGEMRGRVSLESELGSGTRFEILLPEVPAAVVETGLADRAVMAAPKTGQTGPLILLIDDEEDVVRTCRRILETLGYAVESYTDPIVAIEAYEAGAERYALVMTDLVMPGMNGEEVCQSVRTQRPDCPVLLFSSFRPGTLDMDQLAPIQVLEKPIDANALPRVLSEMISDTHLVSEHRKHNS